MNKLFPFLLFCVSIFIAGCAAYFSVKGIGLLFAGSFLPVVIMASSLEIGKLFAVSLLYRQWHVMRFLYKTYLTLACGLLIVITSLGIFGFLSDAYQDTKTKIDHYSTKIISLESQTVNARDQIERLQTSTKSDKLADTDSRDTYKKIYDDFVTQSNTRNAQLNNKLTALDEEIDALESKPGGLFSSKKKKVEELKSQQQSERAIIAKELAVIAERVTKEYDTFITKVDSLSDNNTDSKDISSDIDNLYNQIKENDNQIIQYKSDISQTDIGSFKFISESFGVPVDTAVKWFIFVIVIVFDPLAICLIIGYNMLVLKSNPVVKPKMIVETPKPKTKIVPVRDGDPDIYKRTEVIPGERRVIQFGKSK